MTTYTIYRTDENRKICVYSNDDGVHDTMSAIKKFFNYVYTACNDKTMFDGTMGLIMTKLNTNLLYADAGFTLKSVFNGLDSPNNILYTDYHVVVHTTDDNDVDGGIIK